jgi:L-seryl-tRNA(Ser) seleniumtransferase
MVAESVAAGADVVCFSGDKLLGGVQAGFVVGRRDLVEKLRRNPLKRALRLDKARIAALEAMLRLYLDPERARTAVPTLRFLSRNQNQIRETAQRLEAAVQAWCGSAASVDIAQCASQVGSGSLPVDRLPSAALRIRWAAGKGVGTGLAKMSRAPIPVIGRLHEDALWLDMRCLDERADEALLAQQLERHPL